MNTTIRARATEPATSQQAEGRRPMLDPAIAMLIRSSGDLQLGWDPDRAVLIRPPRGVPASAVATLLDRADGSTSYANLVTAAVSIGIGPEEMAELINELVAMGVLSWAPPPQLTRAAHMHVHGRGPLSDAICQGLALGGQQPSRSHGRLPARRGYPELVTWPTSWSATRVWSPSWSLPTSTTSRYGYATASAWWGRWCCRGGPAVCAVPICTGRTTIRSGRCLPRSYSVGWDTAAPAPCGPPQASPSVRSSSCSTGTPVHRCPAR